MKTERDLVDRTFFNKFLELRKNRLPVDSKIYEFLDDYYRRARISKKKKWSKYLSYSLHGSAINYYNARFSEVQALAKSVFVKSAVSSALYDRGMEIYGFRLHKNSTLAHLLEADIFGEITVNTDIPLIEPLAGLNKKEKTALDLRLITYHFFLHRPQQTEFLFLHELIVGFLGNKLQNRGIILNRHELPINPPDYWAIPAYTVTLLSSFLGRSAESLATLHLASGDDIKKALPLCIQEVLLMAGHIYWYLALYAQGRGESPATLLNLITTFFVNPSIERMTLDKNLRFVNEAGRMVDRLFIERLLGSIPRKTIKANQGDVIRALVDLTNSIWSSRGRSLKSRTFCAEQKWHRQSP